MVLQSAIQIKQWTPDSFLDGISVEQIPKPQAADGIAVIRFTLRPVNPTDIVTLKGKRRHSQTLPFIPGSEGAAVIDDPGSTKFKKGQRVVQVPFSSTPGQGTWQQYLAVPEKNLLAIPDSVGDEDAAQLWVNPLTAYALLDALAAPRGEYVLQTAAGSVLGRELIALAKKRGVKTINVVRRSAQKAEIQQIGGDEVIATDSEDIAERVHQITGGKGAWGAADAVAGETTGQVLRSIRSGGTVFVYGLLSGDTFTVPVFDVFNKSIFGFGVPIYLKQNLSEEQRLKFYQNVIDLVADGTIKPLTGKTYPLEKFKEAVQASEQVGHGGKILLEG